MHSPQSGCGECIPMGRSFSLTSTHPGNRQAANNKQHKKKRRAYKAAAGNAVHRPAHLVHKTPPLNCCLRVYTMENFLSNPRRLFWRVLQARALKTKNEAVFLMCSGLTGGPFKKGLDTGMNLRIIGGVEIQRDCVMVARQTLTLFVRVRILLPLPIENPVAAMVTGLFLCGFFPVYPLIYPLQLLNALDIGLHTGGAVLLHALRHMPVYVQRESRCVVA